MILRVRDLAFRYTASGPWLLDGIDFELDRGDFLTVRGDSGGGKSTLLRLLNRLADPQRGTIEFDGRPLPDYPATMLRTRMVLVFQESAFLEASVEENLLLPFTFRSLRGRGRPRFETCRPLLEQLRLAGIDPSETATRLSVGQRMRLAIARALLLEPNVLLLDEPLAGLDPDSRDALATVLTGVVRERGLAVVSVSHLDWGIGTSTVRRLQGGRLEPPG
ncbi:MAG: ATP-binding cassette domain-containing protein [Puniceicoccaceae bacterium]|nr:MAG: ATP-binding cassette domain-containing protein [Puniceicoccaceae bacterium]